MGKPRRPPPPNMLLLDRHYMPAHNHPMASTRDRHGHSRSPTLDVDPDVGLVGTIALPAQEVDRLLEQYRLVSPTSTVLPHIGILDGPVGHGRVVDEVDEVTHDTRTSALTHHAAGTAAGGTESTTTSLNEEILEQGPPPPPPRVPMPRSRHDHGAAMASADIAARPSQHRDPPHEATATLPHAPCTPLSPNAHPPSTSSTTSTTTALATPATASAPMLWVDIALYRNPPVPSSVTLILALCRVKVFARVLETATAMGVKSIHVIDSVRTEPAYWTSHATDPAFIRGRLIAGLEQAVDTVLPDVQVWRDTDHFLTSVLPPLTQGGVLNVVAHPSPTAKPCPTGVNGRCNLVVGPEGGLVDAEVTRLCDLGFQSLSLGPRILPVETAVHVLLGKLCF
eukprot:m.206299 g.206299  ORF g.206299 m.206299 type:complete len:396 (-) comp23290_c0_seq1:586-1773(-)